MQFKPVFEKRERPVLIAGPCSAETETQVLHTAQALAPLGIDLFRAGIWKPRTRPGGFEGAGVAGLHWLRRVKEETGLRVCTEVANTQHVYEALKFGVDVLWIGARTTVNPFSVQEIADALCGVDVPVLVKNPVNADFKLWLGAIERLHRAGIHRVAAIHRGFSYHGQSRWRNVPRWEFAIELRRLFPDLQLICDHSHICGRRESLLQVAQRAMDLDFDGLMTEVHPDPDRALSDAQQQLTPTDYQQMLSKLIVRRSETSVEATPTDLQHLRHLIDEIDEELFQLLATRMRVARQIGAFKAQHNITILQTARFNEILERATEKCSALELSKTFIETLLRAIHQESIEQQARVMVGALQAAKG